MGLTFLRLHTKIWLLIYFLPEPDMLCAQYAPAIPMYGKIIYHPFSWVVNPAELARDSPFSAGIFTQNNVRVPEISQYFLAGNASFSAGGIGLEAGSYGNESYREWMAGIGYGLNLGKAAIGIKMNYTGITISGFQSQHSYLLKAGSILTVTPLLKAAVVMGFRKTPTLSAYKQDMSSIEYEFGLGYEPSSKLLISMQTGTVDKRFYWKARMNYYFHPSFSALVSVEKTAGMFDVNAGWHLKQFSVHVNCSVQPHSGFSPGIIFCYQPQPVASD